MPTISGTSGDDTLTGTDEADIINALGGNDTVNGGSGDDFLNGSDGDDILDGGDGNDVLAGGLGNDILIGRRGFFKTDIAVFTGNYADYEILTNSDGTATVKGLGAHAADGIDTLYGIETVQFADITVSLGIYANNPPVLGEPHMADQEIDDGASFSYTIPGTAFIELDDAPLNFTATLADGSPLPGWLSFDSDTRTFSGVPPVSAIGVTYDILVTALDQYYDPAEDFDDYKISDSFLLTINQARGPDITGTDGDDILKGTFRDETMIGLSGADRIYGSAGADWIDGGADLGDTVYYSASPQAVTVNLGTGAASGGDAEGDLLWAIESVVGSAFNDSLTGSDGADTMRGGAGDDTLNGTGGNDWLKGEVGNDTLTGGAGYDRMYGGVGDDAYYVTDATDFAYELVGEGHDTVVSSIDHQLRDNVEDLELIGGAVIGKGNALDNAITGNELNNRLYGYGGNDVLDGASGDDIIDGREGNDTLTGGEGYDKMYGGLGDDIFIVIDATDFAYENAGEGYDKVMAAVTHTLRANIEELELTGGSDIRGYGNAYNNLITGNSGANLLYGRDGDDTLRGNDGNDLLYGENGNDKLDGGAGQDRYYGGVGADSFIFDDGELGGLSGSTCDRILDFSQVEGDKINLAEIDASTGMDGDQGFSFIGAGAFSGTAGELRTFQAGGTTYLQGDTNGDGTADFLIRVDGLHSLQASDFLI